MPLACHGEEQPVPQGGKPSVLCALRDIESSSSLLLNHCVPANTQGYERRYRVDDKRKRNSTLLSACGTLVGKGKGNAYFS